MVFDNSLLANLGIISVGDVQFGDLGSQSEYCGGLEL